MANRSLVNYLWLDSETTGLDPVNNDIVQLACIPVMNGIESPNSFNEFCQPVSWDNVDAEALRINNTTLEKLATYQAPALLVNNLVNYLRSFNVKFTIAGYNVGFDRDFLASLFKKVNREQDFLDLFTSDTRDTYKRAKALKTRLATTNIKLATLCAHFNIDINAHDALSDIAATIKLDKILSEMMGEVEIYSVKEVQELNVDFVEPAQLHCHSMFSYTDSLPSIEDLVEWCLKTNTPAFSAVDHGNATSLFEMIRIPSIVEKLNKKNSTSYDPKSITGVPGVGLHVSFNGNNFYLNGWATNDTGYRNLIKLSSIGWSNRITISNVEFPLVSLEDVISKKDGIVFGVPGLNGPICNMILNRQTTEAKTVIAYLNDNLDLRLELASVDAYKYFDSTIGFRSYGIDGGNAQSHINNFYFDISEELNIRCIPVSDSHYLNESDKVIQDCISKNSFKDNRYFFEPRQQQVAKDMYNIIKSHLGDKINPDIFNSLIRNTHDIAEPAKNISIKHDYHLPKIDIPATIASHTPDYGMQCYYYTMQKIKEHGRWNDSPEYVDRFKKEIDVIMKNDTLNFLPYFLVYEDICSYARGSGLFQGIARGSAGGSLLSYYLKVIHVDPVAANLPFERFLSRARIRAGSFPDIDLDIADRARPLVMKYLQDKYGLGFAQIATFNKMKTKNAIKDVMYALYGRNRNDPEVKAVCDQIDDSPQGVDEIDFLYGYTDQEGIEHEGEVHKKPILANFFAQRSEVEGMVKKLIGSIRGWSRHASAFVISTLDLSADRVPTMMMSDKDLGEIMVTQYDATMVEKSNLVKADILGIKTLTMVSDCVDLIKKNHNFDFGEEEKGVPYIYRLPDADKGVFADFYNRDTDSSFQFNTELIKGHAQEFAPLNRADLASMTALCRPGALDAPLYDTMAAQYYMDVRNRKREVIYLHSDLEPILKDSNGVFVYQEEVMKFLVDIVGYSWEESDVIRSAIAKKKHEVIRNTFTRIRESCQRRGWTDEAIETICQQIMAFSRYSFNKSHSYAYGELGYITLYLKHHYPLEWWCSVLNNEDKEDKTRKYIGYLGSKVSSPSLKNPSNHYAIHNNKIVTPISAIKSVGPAVVNEIVAKGPFASLEDYVTRINHSKVNIGGMSALIKARAADDLMDDTILDYPERRLAFMKKYCSIRKSKTEFKEDMFKTDPLSLFLFEREYNQSFNKCLLSQDISKLICNKWPGLSYIGKSGIPLSMKDGESSIPVIDSVKVAESLYRKGYAADVAMILLFQGSRYKTGISKKGRPWHLVSSDLSDGYNTIETAQWDAKKAYGLPVDAIVYVRGKLKPGWRTSVSLDISEMVQIKL